MSVIALHFHGRLGNQIIQYCHARAYAQKHGCELIITHTPVAAPVLKEIFDIANDMQIGRSAEWPVRDDDDGAFPLQDGEVDVCLQGYRSYQRAMIFTKKQAQAWLKLRPGIQERLWARPPMPNIFHQRRGDFFLHAGMTVVSPGSYFRGAVKFGFEPADFAILEEETAKNREQPMDSHLSMLPDFWRMMKCEVLFRSNSTFAWAAALLGDARVFSPVVARQPKNRECDCEFVEGNWPGVWEGPPDNILDRNMSVPDANP